MGQLLLKNNGEHGSQYTNMNWVSGEQRTMTVYKYKNTSSVLY